MRAATGDPTVSPTAGSDLGRPALHDLDRRRDIHDLVVRFYREVVFDDLLEPVFGEVAEVDWSTHIPKLIDYWCRVLLGEPGYDGAILAAHRHVHEIDAFRLEHFDRWYALWVTSIDDGWSGPEAACRPDRILARPPPPRHHLGAARTGATAGTGRHRRAVCPLMATTTRPRCA